jgi:NADPH:quinone reductase-like Zn-dependent oxidoreductase
VADGKGGVALTEIEPPGSRDDDEVLVEVAATSINRVDLRALSTAENGVTPAGGLDVAGRVAAAAADGSGPAVGTRVMGYCSGGAWADRVTVSTSLLAPIPDGLGFAEAAALPTAGLTALRALALGGSLLGAEVLVTGASGGVGSFAVQLARLGGANVTAGVRTRERAGELERVLGTLKVCVGSELGGPYDLILDGIGSSMLSAALGAVAPGGTVVQFGRSAWDSADASPAEIDGTWFARSMGAKLLAMVVVDELRRHASGVRDLTTLARLATDGRLVVPVSSKVPWADAGDAIATARTDGVIGKVVLLVEGTS